MFGKLQLEESFHQFAMISSIICGRDIQEYHIHETIGGDRMMSQMLHNKHIMKGTPIRQEPCLPGEHVTMLVTVLSVGHIHPRTQAICI